MVLYFHRVDSHTCLSPPWYDFVIQPDKRHSSLHIKQTWVEFRVIHKVWLYFVHLLADNTVRGFTKCLNFLFVQSVCTLVKGHGGGSIQLCKSKWSEIIFWVALRLCSRNIAYLLPSSASAEVSYIITVPDHPAGHLASHPSEYQISFFWLVWKQVNSNWKTTSPFLVNGRRPQFLL